MSDETVDHVPVLVEEVMNLFHPQPGDSLLDATLGLGGHSKAFLERTGPTGKVAGLEADLNALRIAQERLEAFKDQVIIKNVNFWTITHSLAKDSADGGGILTKFTHVLFDLGLGSHQLSDPQRGFSFQSPGPLKMRYGSGPLSASSLKSINRLEQRLGYPPEASDMLSHLSAEELTEVLRVYGEERYASRIAQALHNQGQTLTTAKAVGEAIERAVPRHKRLHPATQTFQALRIAVNRELEVLSKTLPPAVEVLKPGGLIGLISFHSLEDRVVKQFFRQQTRGCICPPGQPICTCAHKPALRLVNRRPVTATAGEINNNPRARSAKLRVAQRLRF